MGAGGGGSLGGRGRRRASEPTTIEKDVFRAFFPPRSIGWVSSRFERGKTTENGFQSTPDERPPSGERNGHPPTCFIHGITGHAKIPALYIRVLEGKRRSLPSGRHSRSITTLALRGGPVMAPARDDDGTPTPWWERKEAELRDRGASDASCSISSSETVRALLRQTRDFPREMGCNRCFRRAEGWAP